jgi:uncharacterized cupredoxin-like copper-binding protein
MTVLSSHEPISRRTALAGLGAAGLGVALGLGGRLGHAAAQQATPPAEDYPEVVITAADYHLDLPASIPGGLTRLTLNNEGPSTHHAMFLRVNEGATLTDLEAALTQPDLGPVFAVSTSFGGPEVNPGRQATVIMDLQPGQYMVICLIPDAVGMPHFLMGMQTPVEVTAATGASSTPVADGTVELIDFGFGQMPMQVTPGRHVWKVTNSGQQLHEFLVMRQDPGVTFAQVQAFLQPAPEATPGALVEATPEAVARPEPFGIIGGAAPMSPGQTTWSVLDLEAGEHFVICFLPDPASGAPHFALGMLMPFTVG